jgi:hypothetical protein
MRATRGGEAITLSGPPGAIRAVLPIDVPRERIVPITVAIGGEPAIYRAAVRQFGAGMSELRLRLPADTSPGGYGGEATIDGKPRKIVVEVEPILRIRIHPSQTRLSAPPKSRAEFNVSIANSGNVTFEIPKTSTFDLDDAEGQDRALGRALRAPLEKGERRVDRFFDELRESHGGEARITIANGNGGLEPGASLDVTCVLDVPGTLRAGRSYIGGWQLGNISHIVLVEVTSSVGRPKNGRAKS